MLLCCCRIEQWHWDLSHLWSSQDRNYHCLFTLTWQCGDLFESTQHRQITTHSYRKRREGVTLIFRVVTACRCVGCNIRLYQHFDRGHCLLVVGTYFFETSVTCCDTTWRNSFFSFLVQLPGSYCLRNLFYQPPSDKGPWQLLLELPVCLVPLGYLSWYSD